MSGFNITIKRRRLAAAADPATCEFYFYNIDIGDLLTPIRRRSSRLRCRRFSMSDVYIGRTLMFTFYTVIPSCCTQLQRSDTPIKSLHWNHSIKINIPSISIRSIQNS